MRDPKDIIINGKQLSEILESHKKWVLDQEGGSRADLSGAYLSRADLSGAYLSRAYLNGADLSGAYLSRADLNGADLSRADLNGADLSGAYLNGADLDGAKNSEFAAVLVTIVPEGDIIGWKQCQGNVIVKLLIPADAKRSNATGRKCRAEFAKVLEIFGADEAVSAYNSGVVYRVGETVYPDSFNDNRWDECSNGIHFFITRIEAEKYDL